MEAEFGMLIVETIAKIRRAYFVQKKSIKAKTSSKKKKSTHKASKKKTSKSKKQRSTLR